VGEGSFAEVYRAHDPLLDREVALKVAKPGTLGTVRRVKRFQREARAAGNLRHPNIVPLYETGEDRGQHFLVTAFIRGRTLGAVLTEARDSGRVLPLVDTARIVRRLAEALAYAHGAGVIHRDVKPDNVMVDEKGEPLLMDFGLAVRAEPDESEERLTQQGIAVGTPAYMAPEQARADLSVVGPAADQ
jgi:serine/threonine protein kinase